MTEYLLIGLIVLNIVLIALVAYIFVKYRHLQLAYDYFMTGKSADNLENYIMSLGEDVRDLQNEDNANKEAIRLLNRNLRASFQKSGIVHYNAFKGMGGDLSFAVALLDYTDSGLIINSVHSREGCYIYIKEVDRGKTDIVLGKEEQDALEIALGYVQAD